MTITHNKHKHFATLKSCLWALIVLYTKRTIELEFDNESKYKFKKDDKGYHGWNKVLGMRNWNKKNGRYLVWRYMPDSDTFQIADTYFRVDGQIQFPNAADITLIHGRGSVVWELPKWKQSFPIMPYFGGKLTAPQKVRYELN